MSTTPIAPAAIEALPINFKSSLEATVIVEQVLYLSFILRETIAREIATHAGALADEAYYLRWWNRVHAGTYEQFFSNVELKKSSTRQRR